MLSSISSPANWAALLAWADSMLVLAPQNTGLVAKKIEPLYDGAVFSALLEILDDEYNPARLQQALAQPSATEEQRSRSLHIIHMALNDYARRRCTRLDPLIRCIDFQALAIHPTKQDLAAILVVFLCAFVWYDDNLNRRHEFISMILKLDSTHQSAISIIIRDADAAVNAELNEDYAAPAVHNEVLAVDEDADLAREARIVELQHAADEARRQCESLMLRLSRLSENNHELTDKHAELQLENEELKKRLESEAGNFDKHRLQRQLRENETLIANLEHQRNDLLEQKERLEREKARLEAQVQKADYLIDENQELRTKNEELSKKANMADNLRKKVEAYRPMETELRALQNDKLDIMKAYADLDKAHGRIAAMRHEQEHYAAKMESYEIEIASFNDQKSMWKAENTELSRRVRYLEQQALSDEQTVKDLQDRIQMFDPSARPGTPTATGPSQSQSLSLEDELRDSATNTISMRDIEVQRLQAENALLRNSIGTETEKGLLLQELEDVRTSRQRLQEQYNEIIEKYTIGQAQIDSLIVNMNGEGNEAYSNLRTQILAEQNVSKDLRRQLEAVKQTLSDKERELLQARGDMNAVEKSSFDALEELKKTDGMIAVSLRAELDAERRKSKVLKEESDNVKGQLLAAFIDKDQLRRETEEANRKLQAAIDGQTPSTDFIKQGEKFEKLRAKAKELKEQYDKLELKNRELERTLKAVRAGSEAGAQKAQSEQVIKNLQRENALIATAWYDLNSRLQSNHVVLQRRHDVPKSWLNRQRVMVNATPRR